MFILVVIELILARDKNDNIAKQHSNSSENLYMRSNNAYIPYQSKPHKLSYSSCGTNLSNMLSNAQTYIYENKTLPGDSVDQPQKKDNNYVGNESNPCIRQYEFYISNSSAYNDMKNESNYAETVLSPLESN